MQFQVVYWSCLNAAPCHWLNWESLGVAGSFSIWVLSMIDKKCSLKSDAVTVEPLNLASMIRLIGQSLQIILCLFSYYRTISKHTTECLLQHAIYDIFQASLFCALWRTACFCILFRSLNWRVWLLFICFEVSCIFFFWNLDKFFVWLFCLLLSTPWSASNLRYYSSIFSPCV